MLRGGFHLMTHIEIKNFSLHSRVKLEGTGSPESLLIDRASCLELLLPQAPEPFFSKR